MERYVIVGGVAAGATAAARLRRLDEEADIILIERGPYVSYANCGLPYYIGGEINSRNALFVATKESIEAKYRVKVLDNTVVTAIHPDKKCVDLLNKETDTKREQPYTKLLLATGSSPIMPPFPGIEGERVFKLWTVPDTDAIKCFIDETKPRRAVVVGAGFIGLEMVENLVRLGIEVDLVELMPQVMASLDPDMSVHLEHELAAKGVKLHLGKGLKSIHDGGRRARLDDGTDLACDMILLSIGVRPNNELMKQAGIELNKRGHVITDEGMRTNLPDIYAAGDVIEVTDWVSGERKCVPLAGPANKQGRIAADNMVRDAAGEQAPKETELERRRLSYNGTMGTCIARVFDLTSASTGLNEKQLQALGLEYNKDYAYSLVHPQAHANYFPGALPLNLKLLFSLKDGRILGAQIVGYDGVDKRIDVMASAMHFRGTIYDLTELELAYAPPFSSAKDPVNMAGYAATNIFEGKSRVSTWQEALASDDAHVILDVREAPELLTGSVEGARNIPLTELRDRLDELDKAKIYHTFCAIGIRGYIAERILRQHGFKVRNILGGIRTYRALYGEPSKRKNPVEAQDKIIHDAGDLPREMKHAEPDAACPRSAQKLELLDACGLSCPGPIVEVSKKMQSLGNGDRLRVTATDPGFARDIGSWCDNTGHRLLDQGKDGDRWFAEIEKIETAEEPAPLAKTNRAREKTMIVFSGDLDKAIASFIIANGAAAMGNKVNMFFTFWGLNILRKPEKVKVKKDFMSKMFAKMMPRGSKKLGLSKMNFAGAGSKMIRSIMEKKNIQSLEDLIRQAREAGVKMTACQMSMDVMGITKEELIDGVEVGGVATMLNDNDRSNMNLFI